MSLATLAANLPGTYNLTSIERATEYTYTPPVPFVLIIDSANVVSTAVVATGTQNGIPITITVEDEGGGVTFAGTLQYDGIGGEAVNDFFLSAPILRYRISQIGKQDLIHLYDKQ